jgi:hypothetical protein
MTPTAKQPSRQAFMQTPAGYQALHRVEPTREVDELAHKVIGVAIEVHRTLGPGYGENVYEEAFAVELDIQCIPFERQVKIAVA